MQKVIEDLEKIQNDLSKIEIRVAVLNLDDISDEDLIETNLALEKITSRILKLENLLLRKNILKLSIGGEKKEKTCLINRMDCPYTELHRDKTDSAT